MPKHIRRRHVTINFSEATPAERRGEKLSYILQIWGGETFRKVPVNDF